MRRIATSLVGATLVVASGCGGFDGLGSTVVSREEAQTLGTISRSLPADDRAQAVQALARDAWQREHRFLDAIEPGHLLRATRVRQVEIDAGLWTTDELYQLGGQLFTLHLSPAVGMGGADMPALRRVHDGRRGGPDATRCASCHWRGGLAGAGDAADNALFRGDGNREASAVARNPPALVGAGLRERLAQEMSAELVAQREDLLALAVETGNSIRSPVTAKGLAFGFLTVTPEGDVDPRELEGVDPDLVVKPFGWKGTVATIRDIAEDSLLVHHGMQSEHLVIQGDEARVGPFGGDDPDGDAVVEEILEGQLTALSVFIALQEVPQERPPDDPYLLTLWGQGRQDFDTLGCAECHVPSLPLESATFVLPHRYDGPWLRIDLSEDGAEPRPTVDADSGELRVRLFSDLRRHRMGPQLAEDRSEAGVDADTFITPPLWGLARSRPYLHDGRAPTIEDAILLHGGEAQTARDRFAALDEPQRAPLRVFLTSLTRARRLVAR